MRPALRLVLERISRVLPGIFCQVCRWTSSSVQNVLSSPLGLPPGVLALRPRHRQTWQRIPRGVLLRCALAAGLCLPAMALTSSPRDFLFFDLPPRILNHLLPGELLVSEEGVHFARLPEERVEEWSHRIHTEMGGCGGFIDVTRETQAGALPEGVVLREVLRRHLAPYSAPIRLKLKPEISGLVEAASGTALWGFLDELSSFPDRSATTENGARAAEFLKNKALSLGTELARFHVWTVATGGGLYARQPSVVATYPGTDPSAPGIVIGAHMDTYSTAKPGADDDGSGSATVLEVLRAIAESRSTFRSTIHFVWYSAEERGLVGSGYVVPEFAKQGLKVKAALQLDMVGWDSPADAHDLYLITDYTDPQLTAALRTLVETFTDAKVGETRCGYPCSDHVNWHRAGIPVVFPFESSFENMNNRLHTGEDKLAFLAQAHALRFAKAALAFAGEMAELE